MKQTCFRVSLSSSSAASLTNETNSRVDFFKDFLWVLEKLTAFM